MAPFGHGFSSTVYDSYYYSQNNRYYLLKIIKILKPILINDNLVSKVRGSDLNSSFS